MGAYDTLSESARAGLAEIQKSINPNWRDSMGEVAKNGDIREDLVNGLALAAKSGGRGPGFRPTITRPVGSEAGGLLVAESTVAKSIEDAQERRFVLGVAHPAGWRDAIAKGLDGKRDWMSEENVEKSAWGFMLDGQQIGMYHRDGTVGAAQVVESYIYRGPDWTISDTLGREQVITKGDWLVGGILDPVVWSGYKNGAFSGWSVQGAGKRRAS